MLRLAARLKELRDEKRLAARYACIASEMLGQALTPEALDDFQAGLRAGLLDVETRIRDWARRSTTRAKWIKRFRKRFGGTPKIGLHLDTVAAFAAELEGLRLILRQLGDSFAWIVLDQRPRVIASLFARRTHHLTAGRGMVASVELMTRAHATGKFLVVDNDLTRCLGDADLTVVRYGRPWTLPVTYELKAPSPSDDELKVGDDLVINSVSALSGDRGQAALHEDFVAALGLNDGNIGLPAKAIERQQAGMERRAKVLLALAGPRSQLPRRESYWRTIETVIAKAQTYGSSFDAPERGLVYGAVCGGDRAEALLESLLARVVEFVPAGEYVLTTEDLFDRDDYGAFVPPIMLWRLPIAQRVALLSGDILLFCAFTSDLFRRAFEEVGLSFEDDRRSWVISDGDETVRFERLEVIKLELGVAFNAMSPRALARACAAEIRQR